MTPHSEIARKFQQLFPYFVPQDMDQAAYEEAFIKRAKEDGCGRDDADNLPDSYMILSSRSAECSVSVFYSHTPRI